MFTGLIECMGTVVAVRERGSGVEVRIEAPEIAPELSRGESVAVDGCCLTVETFDAGGFTMFASPETMRKTALGDRKPGSRVNLERALAFGARLGGHLVSGHVDTTGRFRSARATGEAWEVWIEAPESILRQSIAKGSVAVDGISLTIVDLTDEAFSLWIIPETWERTTLALRAPGDRVNLESDLIGKYVGRYLEGLGGGGAERDKQLREVWERFNSV